MGIRLNLLWPDNTEAVQRGTRNGHGRSPVARTHSAATVTTVLVGCVILEARHLVFQSKLAPKVRAGSDALQWNIEGAMKIWIIGSERLLKEAGDGMRLLLVRARVRESSN